MNLRTLLLTLVVTATACGGSPPSGSDVPEGDAVVVRIEHIGGFVPVRSLLTRVPQISIHGDGRVIMPGAVAEIFPGPLMHPMFVHRVGEGVLQEILDRALAEGLLEGDRELGNDTIADAATTRFIIQASGEIHQIDAYAFEEGGENPGLRQRLRDFRRFVEELVLEDPVRSDPDPYVPEELQIAWAPPQGEDPEGFERQRMRWPLEEPPGEAGEPFSVGGLQFRCVSLTGAEAERVFGVLRKANDLSVFVFEGQAFDLYPGQLMPDQEGCQPPGF